MAFHVPMSLTPQIHYCALGIPCPHSLFLMILHELFPEPPWYQTPFDPSHWTRWCIPSFGSFCWLLFVTSDSFNEGSPTWNMRKVSIRNRPTLDCHKSNVYAYSTSSRVIFSECALISALSLYTLPYEISVQSPTMCVNSHYSIE